MGNRVRGNKLGVLQCVAVCCSVLQCVAVCCSVLQCIEEKRVGNRVRGNKLGARGEKVGNPKKWETPKSGKPQKVGSGENRRRKKKGIWDLCIA